MSCPKKIAAPKENPPESTGGLSKSFEIDVWLVVSPPRHGMPVVMMASVMIAGGKHEIGV